MFIVYYSLPQQCPGIHQILWKNFQSSITYRFVSTLLRTLRNYLQNDKWTFISVWRYECQKLAIAFYHPFKKISNQSYLSKEKLYHSLHKMFLWDFYHFRNLETIALIISIRPRKKFYLNLRNRNRFFNFISSFESIKTPLEQL